MSEDQKRNVSNAASATAAVLFGTPNESYVDANERALRVLDGRASSDRVISNWLAGERKRAAIPAPQGN